MNKIQVRIERFDKNGRLIEVVKKPLNSYVQNHIDYLRAQWSGTNSGVTNLSGTSRNVQTSGGGSTGWYTKFVVAAGVADDSYGLVVGTGTNAVAISQTALQTKILHGDVSAKLNHGSVSVGNPATVGSTRQFTIARTFTNNSGADITVEEIGLYAQFYYSSSTMDITMIERSLLHYVIPNGQSASFTYTISATV